MRLVRTENLTPDMILANNVYKQGCIYLKQGQRNICRYDDRLKNLGVDYVYVVDKASEDIEIKEIVSEATRQRCQDVLRMAFKTIENNAPIDVNSFKAPVSELLSEVMINKDLQVSLTDISTMDEYTFGHSVSTSIYALLIAQEMGFSKSDLHDLAMGAVLHDVGKVKIYPRVLFKEGRLSDEEFQLIQSHPRYSYEILKYCRNLTNRAKLIAFQHHERLDGSGYPNGITGDQLGVFTRVTAVADVYDALTTNRCYRSKWSNSKAVDLLMKYAGIEFDEKMVASLIKKIAIYPNGTEVRLSDGTYGLVAEQNKNMPFRPVVKVLWDKDGFDISPYRVDLMKDLNITIIESQIELHGESN